MLKILLEANCCILFNLAIFFLFGRGFLKHREMFKANYKELNLTHLKCFPFAAEVGKTSLILTLVSDEFPDEDVSL